jgi:sugar O-acyltransferase (sialic acid O-acetyltransferase NeuD family)
MKKIAIIGAGGNARELADMFQAMPEFQLVGFLTNTRGKNDSPAVGDFNWPATHRVDAFAMGIGDPILKIQIGHELARRYPHVEWPSIVHPSAYVGNTVTLARGAIVCVRAVATVAVNIGEFSQLNFGCTVGHETVIGPGCLVNPGANISGGVKLGRSVMVGTGAQILQYVIVGDEARIGAGAVVTKDVPPATTVVGVPAMLKTAKSELSARRCLDKS